MTALPDDLHPDCAACLGLCCVAPAFDSGQGFGYDKPAATACRHLQADCRCGIHERLIESGFPGCVRYDCYGAGQRAVRDFGAELDWRRDIAGSAPLFSAFQRLRGLHELKALVHFTLGRITDDSARAELHERLSDIEALCRDAGSDAVRLRERDLRSSTIARLRELLPVSPSHS